MAAPSYYPPGWNKERWLSAPDEEFNTVTKEQFEAFHTGLRADLSEDGVKEFFDEVDRRQAERSAAESAPTAIEQVFSTLYRVSRRGRIKISEWGFVVFQTSGYSNNNSGKVLDIKEKIQAMIDQRFDDAKGGPLDQDNAVQHARDTFCLRWIEGADLDGATPQEVSRRYRELLDGDTLGLGLEHPLCLCVDASSVKSLILQEQSGGQGLAHVLAVSNTCGLEVAPGDEFDDDPEWTGTFKVAVSSLITELFSLVCDNDLTPYEIWLGVPEDFVWTGSSRFGREKALC